MKNVAEILEALGGHAVVAAALNCSQSALRTWKMERKIPSHRYPDLLRLAKSRGVKLTYDDLTEAR